MTSALHSLTRLFKCQYNFHISPLKGFRLAMDYAREVAELKAKLDSKKAHFLNVDQLQREIRKELSLKRNQVLQLKKDLDEANSRNFELTRQLEAKNSALKEVEFNLKLAIKKASSLEEKLKEIHDSHMKMKLKEEIRVSEINMLNEKVQTLGRDNHQLTRDLDEAVDKLKYYDVYQKELEDRQAKINTTLAKFKEGSEKLEKEFSKISEFGNGLQSAEEFKNISQNLISENKKLEKRATDLENQSIEIEAKCQKLESCLKTTKNANLSNLNARLQFLQWENRCKQFAEKLHINEALTDTLTAALKQEVEANARLVLKNEEYESHIQELEKKIACIFPSYNPEKLKKESYEVIEIE